MLLDIHDKKTMTATVRKLRPGGSYIGQGYLPSVSVPTARTVWDIVDSYDGIAQIRAVDAEAHISDRDTFEQAEADLVDIAEKERFNVSDLQLIREAGDLPVELLDGTSFGRQVRQAEQKQRDALVRLRRMVDNRVEKMRIDALQGSVTYNANNVIFNVDYGIPSDQSAQAPAVLWDTVATATPMENIQDWDETVNDRTGTHFGTMICSTKVLKYISRNQTIRDVLQYTNPMFSVNRARRLLEEELGMNIVLYDTQYSTGKGASKTYTRFLPENRVIFLPRLESGDTLGDLAVTGHPHSNWQPGYYTWTEEKKDPYAVYVGVGLQSFPRLFHARGIFTADVLA